MISPIDSSMLVEKDSQEPLSFVDWTDFSIPAGQE